ncbi:MAG: hypothetical protein WDN26_22850 [Chitinophagaceae bacterium]
MKPLLILLISLALACNNNKKVDGNEATTGADSTTTANQLQKEEELQSLTAYTPEQMETLLPQELAGAKISDTSSGKATGTAYARGVYSPNDSTTIELSLFDCGGSEGSGFYKFQFLNMLDAAAATEEEENKTIDYKGGKAIEHYDANSYRSSFTYLADRFLVTLESESLDVEGLKKIAGGLKLK